MASTLSSPGKAVLKPSHLAHIVLKTTPENFSKMQSFYQIFLSASIRFSSGQLSFLTYDDEHHRIAIVAIPGTKLRDPEASGLLHFAVTFDSLNDLALAYLQRKENGFCLIGVSIMGQLSACIIMIQTEMSKYNFLFLGVHLGQLLHKRTSIDFLSVETQVECYPDAESATEFMMGHEFAENPIGVDYDPDDLVRRLQAGESDESIKKRANIGPRNVPGIPAMAH